MRWVDRLLSESSLSTGTAALLSLALSSSSSESDELLLSPQRRFGGSGRVAGALFGTGALPRTDTVTGGVPESRVSVGPSSSVAAPAPLGGAWEAVHTGSAKLSCDVSIVSRRFASADRTPATSAAGRESTTCRPGQTMCRSLYTVVAQPPVRQIQMVK